MSGNANVSERVFPWTDDSMRWYRDAETYENNNRCKVLSEMILSELPEMPTIADIGCGLGYLSIELSKSAKKILAMDFNEAAITALRSEIEERGITNIEAVEGDFELIEPKETFDAALLCMFGGSRKFLPLVEKWTKDKIILVVNSAKKRSFSVGDVPSKNSGDEMIAEYLESEGYSFKKHIAMVEFGQPLESRDDAYSFTAHYNVSADRVQIETMLEERLIKTGRSDFPYCIPCEKNYAFFVIDKRAL